ncbi:MAG: hypothetical protein JJT94_01890 [Bernardetiaceae bacterium]|nr:hypothetical protein [Bernardetiaceae bacterium]
MRGDRVGPDLENEQGEMLYSASEKQGKFTLFRNNSSPIELGSSLNVVDLANRAKFRMLKEEKMVIGNGNFISIKGVPNTKPETTFNFKKGFGVSYFLDK